MNSSSGSPLDPRLNSTESTTLQETQLITDLQKQLRELAQHNRESVDRALLSTANHTTTLTSSSGTADQSAISRLALQRKEVILGRSVSTPSHASTSVPDLSAVSRHSDQPLPLSTSNPVLYSSNFAKDEGKSSLFDGPRQFRSPKDVMNQASIHSGDNRDLSTFQTNGLAEQLYNTKAQVFQLDAKLKECNDICEQQKVHFRTALADLQLKLNETIVGRNSVMELRRNEAESQERLINQMQQTFAEVKHSNQQQAQSLQDAGSQVARLQTDLHTCVSALAQVNTLAVLYITRRGLTSDIQHRLAYSGPADTEGVLKALKELMAWYEGDLTRAMKEVDDAKRTLTDVEIRFEERWRRNAEEQTQTLHKLSEDHERQLSAATEKVTNAHQQMLSLQSQLSLKQDQMKQEIDQAGRRENDLQQTLKHVEEQADKMYKDLQTKHENVSSELRLTESRLKDSSQEKEELVDKVKFLDQQLHSTKELFSKAEGDLQNAHEVNRQLTSLRQEAIAEAKRLSVQLEVKTSFCEELSRHVEQTKQDSARRMEEKEQARQEELKDQLRSLNSQLGATNRQCETLAADLREKDGQLRAALQSIDGLAGTLGQMKGESEGAAEEKTSLCLLLADRGKELQTVQRERQCLEAALEERNDDLRREEKMTAELESRLREKAIDLKKLEEQSSSMAEIITGSKKDVDELNIERTQMQKQLEEQAKEFKAVSSRQESISKKLKVREKRVLTLEADNKTLQKQLQEVTVESETGVRTREELSSQLTQAQEQAESLNKELQKYQSESQTSVETYQGSLAKYKARIIKLQAELCKAHKAIRTATASDTKAVKVAETMQKHVTANRSRIDKLQGEIHWLKECLDITRNEKSLLVGERDRYKTKLSAAVKTTQNLLEEREAITNMKRLQSGQVANLEGSLKEAAVKYSECQAVIERQEQDLARLKLRHQLEIKELQRATSRGNPAAGVTAKRTKVRSDLIDRGSPVYTLPLAPKNNSPVSERTPARNKPEAKGGDESLTRADTGPAPSIAAKLITDEEVNKLLLDMYRVVSGRPNLCEGSGETEREASKGKRSNGYYDSRFGAKDGSAHTKESGYDSKSQTHHEYKLGINPPLLSSSPAAGNSLAPSSSDGINLLSSVEEVTGDRLQASTPRLDFLQGSHSPVANLLSASPQDAATSVRLGNGSSHSNDQWWPVSISSGSSPISRVVVDTRLGMKYRKSDSGNVGASITDEHDKIAAVDSAHLKQLSQKLESLSRIGGHLKKENKDLATQIKRHGSKLKQCRQQEESIHRLASTKNR